VVEEEAVAALAALVVVALARLRQARHPPAQDRQARRVLLVRLRQAAEAPVAHQVAQA
jgi:hypothetical protein